MKERPILFSAAMVRAILVGQKTMTRRVMKEQPSFDATGRWAFCVDSTDRRHKDTWNYSVTDRGGHKFTERGRESEVVNLRCPYGQAGDRLWVRESFRLRADQDGKPPREDWWKSGAWYPADGPHTMPSGCAGGAGRLRPSIHMPRWASRITLEITGVRVERVQDISNGDIEAEGACNRASVTHRLDFQQLWDSINAKRGFGWDVNPWVWVIEFRRIDG